MDPTQYFSPRVAVVLTGGTIDSLGKDRLDLARYIEFGQRLGPGELLGRVPELASIAEVHEVPFRRVPSHGLIDRDWLDLLRLVHADSSEGIVITHGTNTLEETAFFLALTLPAGRPVVVTGAMRPALGLSSDGDLNLLNAVRVAASPEARGKGCLVVLNDTIFAARDVTKTNTYRVQTFSGRDLGPLGYADADGRVVFSHRPEKKHTLQTEFDVFGLDSLPRVDVVVSYVGADGALIDAAVGAGAQGIVSAGTGAGRPTPREDEALDRAVARGVLVCQSSRVGSGRVARAPSLVKRGMVAADNLVPWKARALLALALTRTREPAEIQRMFDEY
jgi:L-asparaginase